MSTFLGHMLSTNDVSRVTKIDKYVVKRHIMLGRLITEQFSQRGSHMIHPNEFRRWITEVVKIKSS